jgi:hypothetical protein
MGASLYLGRWAGAGQGQEALPAKVSADRFTTHAVVIGMTGSGKTGLLVDILEEAAMAGIPALVIDPKGDLTNRCLVFPRLSPEEFSPYVPPGKAEEVAARWRDGLAKWGLGEPAAAALKAVPVRVFTPGSLASPLNVLERFASPGTDDPEAMTDKALSAVASLFALAGLDADPSTSPEGLLLAHLLLKTWGEGGAPSLESLVQLVLNPPIQKIGIMDLDAVLPPKDRTALAMRLNALLASPSLSDWRQGPPLDLDAMLGESAGGTQTIFTLSHLSEGERLFFLGLLLSDLAAWVRRRPGSDALKALVLFDEVFGFFPPHPQNPPTKAPLLTLLKQARAFGVGLVLATQNPVDIDYKGLTNAGLWFLGRLQTEPDRRRVADALGALPGGGSASDLLGGLPPRTFVVHDVKEDTPRLMETRWCMSYLAGPLAPPQLKALVGRPPSVSTGEEALARTGEREIWRAGEGSVRSPAPAPQAPSAPAPQVPDSPAPSVPAGWVVAYGPGARLSPHLEVEAEIAYRRSPKAPPVMVRSRWTWPLKGSTLEFALAADAAKAPESALAGHAASDALLEPLPPYFDDLGLAKVAKAAEESLALRQRLTLLRDPLSKAVQDPSEDEGAFRGRIARVREEARRAEETKTLGPLARQLEKAGDRVRKAEHRLDQDRSDASARKTETALSAGLGVLGGLFGSKRSLGGAISRTASKYRQADRAGDRVAGDQAELDDARRDRDALQARLVSALRDLAARYADPSLETVTLTPPKSGVQVLAARLLWLEAP